MDLGNVNKCMKVKFSLILKSDNELPMNKLVSKFKMQGNEYIKFNPHPFVTIEITNELEKKEGWSNSRIITLNKLNLFRVMMVLKRFINRFVEVKDLFYFQGDTLCLNNDVAKNEEQMIRVANDKVILLKPFVVSDEEGMYEGCIFMINSAINYCKLTYEELKYLHYLLSHIDMEILSLQLMDLSVKMSTVKPTEYQSQPRLVSEEIEEPITSKPNITVEEVPIIPNI